MGIKDFAMTSNGKKFKNNRLYKALFCYSFLLLQSCVNTKQNALFQTGKNFNEASFEEVFLKASKNYTIEKFDNIAISVFTNNGEILVDPNREFQIGDSQASSTQNNNSNQQNTQQSENSNSVINLSIRTNNAHPISYRINDLGIVKLPLLGEVKLEGLTLLQADSLLEIKYSNFYEDAFVITQYLNKRVILLGALGDRIIPLYNENMNLIEILALAGNISQSAKLDKIKIIRGDLKNPSIQLIDISTIQGISRANLLIQPNDIIYIEPKIKLDIELLSKTISAVTGIISSTLTIVLFIDRIK